MPATLFTDLSSTDPLLLYTLVAALFLGFVSLWSGWRRKDFLIFFRPQGLLHIAGAVLFAFALTLASQYLLNMDLSSAQDDFPWLPSLRGLSRFPLYVIALAYGPSAGLLAAALFASFSTTTALPGLPEAVLALELMVLGWFAIAPSPRRYRWAGPFGALMAYFLAWATGGSAMLQALTGEATQWATHANYHTTLVLGAGLSMLFLSLIGPKLYRTWFPTSGIAPGDKESLPVQTKATSETVPRRRTPLQSPPTFGSLWGNDASRNPFMSKAHWQLTFTQPPELVQKRGEPSRKRRSLDDLDLQELRAKPERRHTDTEFTNVSQFERRGRLSQDLEPPALED